MRRHGSHCSLVRRRLWPPRLVRRHRAAPPRQRSPPIGNLGDTLRVQLRRLRRRRHRARRACPTDVPPGCGPTARRAGATRAVPGAPSHRARHPGAQPVHSWPSRSTFSGVTPYADAYAAKQHRRAGRAETALLNAPPGADRQRRRLLGCLPRPGHQRRAARTRRPAPTWRSGTSGSRARRYPDVDARRGHPAAERDLPELADVAATHLPAGLPTVGFTRQHRRFIADEPRRVQRVRRLPRRPRAGGADRRATTAESSATPC